MNKQEIEKLVKPMGAVDLQMLNREQVLSRMLKRSVVYCMKLKK